MSSTDIGKIDKNLSVELTVDAPDAHIYNVKDEPFELYGLYNAKTESEFKRMPDDIAKNVNESVAELYTCTAGGRVRFSTDSPYIVIKAVMPKIMRFPHMPLTGSSGFDLYFDSPDGMESTYFTTFVPPYKMTDGYESKKTFTEPGLKYITINFPLYNAVSELYIGLKEGSYVGKGAPYRKFDPIVFYGSSITEGGCASHPGNVYTNMVGRELNIDTLNLGFSSGAKGEDIMIDYMADLDMSVFVADYDHNQCDRELLRTTHRELYKKVRAAHPDIPYIIMSRPDFYTMNQFFGDHDQSVIRRKYILETYHYAYENGDRNVYFIDGESLMRGAWESDCTVDGAHPNDLGFSRMANAVVSLMKRLLSTGKVPRKE